VIQFIQLNDKNNMKIHNGNIVLRNYMECSSIWVNIPKLQKELPLRIMSNIYLFFDRIDTHDTVSDYVWEVSNFNLMRELHRWDSINTMGCFAVTIDFGHYEVDHPTVSMCWPPRQSQFCQNSSYQAGDQSPSNS
jgi:hypothetical protein